MHSVHASDLCRDTRPALTPVLTPTGPLCFQSVTWPTWANCGAGRQVSTDAGKQNRENKHLATMGQTSPTNTQLRHQKATGQRLNPWGTLKNSQVSWATRFHQAQAWGICPNNLHCLYQRRSNVTLKELSVAGVTETPRLSNWPHPPASSLKTEGKRKR